MSFKHEIEVDRCKGCGLCVDVCPKNVLELSKNVSPKGYFPAYQARPEDCIHCTLCCVMCPDVAITITQTEAAAKADAPMENKTAEKMEDI